jgi:proteic killer suppression protein
MRRPPLAIRSCRDKRTSAFLAGKRVPAFQAFASQAAKAIAKLQSAPRLIDLRNPPSNRLEALGGDRKGEYSIRINDQWRICFRWAVTEAADSGKDPMLLRGEAFDIEITDYH